MAIDFNSAVGAYDKALRSGLEPGVAKPDNKAEGVNFSEMLKDASQNLTDKLNETERQTIKAASGTASVDEVIVAVTQAEMTLKTGIAVRNKAIEAYQAIIRMPI